MTVNVTSLHELRDDALRILIALDDLSRGVGVPLQRQMTAAGTLAQLIDDAIEPVAIEPKANARKANVRKAKAA